MDFYVFDFLLCHIVLDCSFDTDIKSSLIVLSILRCVVTCLNVKSLLYCIFGKKVKKEFTVCDDASPQLSTVYDKVVDLWNRAGLMCRGGASHDQ